MDLHRLSGLHRPPSLRLVECTQLKEEGVCMCTTVLNTSYTKSHVLQQKGGEGKGGGRGRACICSLMQMMA